MLGLQPRVVDRRVSRGELGQSVRGVEPRRSWMEGLGSRWVVIIGVVVIDGAHLIASDFNPPVAVL